MSHGPRDERCDDPACPACRLRGKCTLHESGIYTPMSVDEWKNVLEVAGLAEIIPIPDTVYPYGSKRSIGDDDITR